MRKIFLLMATATLLLTGCKKQTFDERVQTEVENFNLKEAPKQLDPYTSFDSMRYDADIHTVHYYYTVSGDADGDLFPAEELKQQLVSNVRNSLQLKAHKEHGLSFHYVYQSQSSGLSLIDCTVKPEDYK
ncbi:MAG: hypothetical protein ILA39_05480 [Bacteroidaceae bacterium]|nr:hypothetical protein [Bacteroidaceae bacterium]